MDFELKHKITKERLDIAAQKIYKLPPSELENLDDPLSVKTTTHKLGLYQWPSSEEFMTRIDADEGPVPLEAARILAIEGDTEVLYLDESGRLETFSDEDGTYIIGPYYLVKPDGSIHRARLSEDDLMPIILD